MSNLYREEIERLSPGNQERGNGKFLFNESEVLAVLDEKVPQYIIITVVTNVVSVTFKRAELCQVFLHKHAHKK